MQTLLNTPHEIIQRNILSAAAKAKTRILNILVLGMMAGSFIAMGHSPAVWRSIISPT